MSYDSLMTVDDQEMTEGFLQIGLFSRLCMVSVRMLRHYQVRGLLTPLWIDPLTGYRYYGQEQLRVAQRIRRLRDAGMGIEGIKEALEVFDNPLELRRRLHAHRSTVEDHVLAVDAQLQGIDQLLLELESADMKHEIVESTLPPMMVLGLRAVIDTYADEGQLWQRFGPLYQQAAGNWDAHALTGAVFHDPDYKESEVDVEVWGQVSQPVSPEAPLAFHEWPARRVLMTTVFGPYEAIQLASDALARFAVEKKTDCGSMFNICRVGPGNEPDPAKWVTDLCLPVL